MTTTGLDVFDRTVQETNVWLKIVMHELGSGDRKLAFTALRAFLHALRDRIGPENAVHLAAQLPMLLRGAFFEGWKISITPSRERHLEEFLAHVGNMLPLHARVTAESAAVAGFAALAEHLDDGEYRKVLEILPTEVRALSSKYRCEPSAV